MHRRRAERGLGKRETEMSAWRRGQVQADQKECKNKCPCRTVLQHMFIWKQQTT